MFLVYSYIYIDYRVIGVSEYEVVSEDNHETGDNHDLVTHLPHPDVSPLNEKMRQMSLLSSRKEVEKSKNSWTIVQTFKFLQLQLRDKNMNNYIVYLFSSYELS